MQPQDSLTRLRWIENSLESLYHEVSAIDAQLRVLTAMPPALDKEERELAAIVRRQLALIRMQGEVLTAALRKLRPGGH